MTRPARRRLLPVCGTSHPTGTRSEGKYEMPIRPENRDRYGDDWRDFSAFIRFDRARGRCECNGECGRAAEHLAADGRCVNIHLGRAYRTGSKVVLTVAHLCHTPECRDHVKAMCQGCHLHYDREHHAHTRELTRRDQIEAAGQSTFDFEGTA